MADDPRELARRARPASGPVEDYESPDEDPDAPQAADVERFGDVTVKCPECGTELYDDVAVCWKCGRALSARDTDVAKVPTWAVATVIVVIVAFLLYLTLARLF